MNQPAFTTTEDERKDCEMIARITAQKAGEILMQYYAQAETDSSILDTEIKEDNSPVTAADKASQAFIISMLKKMTPGYPVVSEENETQPHIAPGTPYWVVDPLDGTKEFLHRTGGFSVKIALIDNDIPVVGAVCSPAQNTLYYSRWGQKAYRETPGLPLKELSTRPAQINQKGTLSVLFNERHASKDAYTALREKVKPGLNLPAVPYGNAGLPRNLQVAEGLADIFADCGGNDSLKSGCGYSWDYAADWLILKNSGGMMVEVLSGKEPDFRNPTARRNAYLAIGDKNLGKRLFPNA